MQRVEFNTVRSLAGIAGVVYLFAPVHTATQQLLSVGALLVFIICAIAAPSLDEENTGYWPKPK